MFSNLKKHISHAIFLFMIGLAVCYRIMYILIFAKEPYPYNDFNALYMFSERVYTSIVFWCMCVCVKSIIKCQKLKETFIYPFFLRSHCFKK